MTVYNSIRFTFKKNIIQNSRGRVIIEKQEFLHLNTASTRTVRMLQTGLYTHRSSYYRLKRWDEPERLAVVRKNMSSTAVLGWQRLPKKRTGYRTFCTQPVQLMPRVRFGLSHQHPVRHPEENVLKAVPTFLQLFFCACGHSCVYAYVFLMYRHHTMWTYMIAN